MKRWIWILYILLIETGIGFSQEGNVSVESRVDRSKITIGDRIKYSIFVTKDENLEVEMPEVGANLGAFEILDYNDPEPQKENGKIQQRREYIISTFDVGEFEIPPVTIRFANKGDTVWQELTTEKIKIEVESLKPSEAGDIRDIKPPLELQRDLKTIIRLSIAGVVLILLALLIYYFIKRKKEGKSLLPKRVKAPRSAHEIALEELDQLTHSDMLEQGEVKRFYSELSEIIRKYMEGRFYIVAIEMTTEQLINNMKQVEIENNIIELTYEFLDSCDLVKFAKYIPTQQENELAIQQAYDIVNLTKIVLQEMENKEGALKEQATGDSKTEPNDAEEMEPEVVATDEEEE